MVMSESVNSVIGLTRSSSSYDGYSTHHTTIPVTAEIVCPTPPPPAAPLMTVPSMPPMTSMAITSPTITMSREEVIRHSIQTSEASPNHHYPQKENATGKLREPSSISQVYSYY